ncbi:c-type cytochrome [Acetobacter oeni]|uniref:Cytochrome c domain-containing protein n=1 Tax=Acetobacter oeni TaxID=304077 RepID=A0A511XPJ1_9PROT|nr:c-type cytochrome [Acetobacter oeni]MBB3884642.1 cytochrome c553 [Acetobacter oeni]NHO20595.1 c-type cytochrome [Acetobacter oeni]GBR03884.1 hypothetical protein AA21952_1207 [Acetobacter oeni LMG 21952]GEN64880.1 hypothetical protein AOE01nite_31040 [Acetobacter oeni]
MSDDRRPVDERFEPYEPRRRVPLPVYWIAIALAIWGTLTLWRDAHAGFIAGRQRGDEAAADTRRAAAPGADLFLARCSSCHQPDGSGIAGAVPPLAGSPLVKADPSVVVRILLRGIDGPITVAGQHFDGHMPSFASVLDDDQLARIATYVRARFGDNASAVSPSDVAAARAWAAGHPGPWRGGDEIRAALMPLLEPQPAYVASLIAAPDPSILALVQHGTGGGWSCASCHGDLGEGHGDAPRIAGLSSPYLLAQLRAFAGGARTSDAMAPVATSLADAQKIALASYYSQLATPSASVPALQGALDRGEALALDGDSAKGIPACFSCHGSSGFGVAPAFPPIAAQQPAYTAGRLAGFARQAKQGSHALMPSVAARLDDADRRAIADYLATLPPVPTGTAPPAEQH